MAKPWAASQVAVQIARRVDFCNRQAACTRVCEQGAELGGRGAGEAICRRHQGPGHLSAAQARPAPCAATAFALVHPERPLGREFPLGDELRPEHIAMQGFSGESAGSTTRTTFSSADEYFARAPGAALQPMGELSQRVHGCSCATHFSSASRWAPTDGSYPRPCRGRRRR